MVTKCATSGSAEAAVGARGIRMDVARTIPLSGFDSQGDPEIRVLADGRLSVVFNFMPPSDVENRDFGPDSDFDAQMSAAVGVPVRWEDREFFRIDSPHADTIDRLATFISTYRERSNPADLDKFGSEGTCFERGCPPFAAGQRVRHFRFGEGEVINYDRHGDDALVRVRFLAGVKWLLTGDPAKLWAVRSVGTIPKGRRTCRRSRERGWRVASMLAFIRC